MKQSRKTKLSNFLYTVLATVKKVVVLQKPNTYRMETKKCTKCKTEKPNNEDYFHLDSRKVKLGHNIVLAAACKSCKNVQKKITGKKRRAKIAEEFGTVYKFRKLNDPYFLDKCNEREKRYSVKKLERNKKYRKEKKPYILEADKIRAKKNKTEVEEITDYYVARLIYRNDKSTPIKEILKNKEFIELYILNLKIKRLCRQ